VYCEHQRVVTYGLSIPH